MSDAEVAELRAKVEQLQNLIAEMVDEEPCWFDRWGGCQAHGYLSLKPGETCPQYDAQQIVAAME